MKEKKQSLKPTIVVWSIAIMVFIVGNMLSANPVRALNELVFQSPIPQPTTQPTSSPTPDPTSSPTPDPTSSPTTQPTSSPTPDPSLTPTTDPVPTSAVLKINGPESVAVGEKVQLSVEAQNVSGNGLYGVQFEVNFDPSLISVSNLQANPDLSVVLKNTADNIAGKISLVASRQGPVPGLTGNVSLLTFDVTAVGGTGTATLSLANAKMGDPQAAPLAFTSENFTLLIEDGTTTPEPTSTPTGQPTPQPTDEPTPQPTDEPTPQPTDEPTPQPTDEPTPQPTDEPGNAGVSGQVILTGRANNNWSGGTVTVDDTQQSATTDPSGNFTIANVAPGSHSSITADAPGYLPAVCAAVTITAPQTALLPVNLLSGDVNDDKLADIADATAIGVSFGQTGPNQPTDINRDEIVDIYDLILVSVNFGQGAQTWSCQAK